MRLRGVFTGALLVTAVVAAAPPALADAGGGGDAVAGQQAAAEWWSGNDNQFTDVYVQGTNGVDALDPTGGPQQGVISVFQAACDTASDTLIFREYDSDPMTSGFSMAPDLSTAQLSGPATFHGNEFRVAGCENPADDGTSTDLGTFPVTVNFNWTATGSPQPGWGEENAISDDPLGCVFVEGGGGADVSRTSSVTSGLTGQLPLLGGADLNHLGTPQFSLLDAGAGAGGAAVVDEGCPTGGAARAAMAKRLHAHHRAHRATRHRARRNRSR